MKFRQIIRWITRMNTIASKQKYQSFFLWIYDNLFANKIHPWRQIGVWLLMLALLVLWSSYQ